MEIKFNQEEIIEILGDYVALKLNLGGKVESVHEKYNDFIVTVEKKAILEREV